MTPASSTKWTAGCAASRADARCASRVLPRPPAPTIGHDARAGQQRPQARHVVVAADQLGRVVAQPAAHRPVEGQQRHAARAAAARRGRCRTGRAGPGGGARSAPAPRPGLGPRPRCAAGRPAAPRRAGTRYAPPPAAGGACGWAPVRLGGAGQDDRARLRRRRPRLGGSRRAGRRLPRRSRRHLRARLARPSARASRARSAARAASLSSAEAAARTRPASLALSTSSGATPSRYPAPSRTIDVRPAGAARPRHQHLQALHAVGGRRFAPDQLDQLRGPDRAAAPRGQGRQQRLRALPHDGDAVPAHVFQEGQCDGHRPSLEARRRAGPVIVPAAAPARTGQRSRLRRRSCRSPQSQWW